MADLDLDERCEGYWEAVSYEKDQSRMESRGVPADTCMWRERALTIHSHVGVRSHTL
jgi:hypothetical protein